MKTISNVLNNSGIDSLELKTQWRKAPKFLHELGSKKDIVGMVVTLEGVYHPILYIDNKFLIDNTIIISNNKIKYTYKRIAKKYASISELYNNISEQTANRDPIIGGIFNSEITVFNVDTHIENMLAPFADYCECSGGSDFIATDNKKIEHSFDICNRTTIAYIKNAGICYIKHTKFGIMITGKMYFNRGNLKYINTLPTLIPSNKILGILEYHREDDVTED